MIGRYTTTGAACGFPAPVPSASGRCSTRTNGVSTASDPPQNGRPPRLCPLACWLFGSFPSPRFPALKLRVQSLVPLSLPAKYHLRDQGVVKACPGALSPKRGNLRQALTAQGGNHNQKARATIVLCYECPDSRRYESEACFDDLRNTGEVKAGILGAIAECLVDGIYLPRPAGQVLEQDLSRSTESHRTGLCAP
mgnify:CR=1 FL=1